VVEFREREEGFEGREEQEQEQEEAKCDVEALG
jgi:hypothetical protein